jgi:AraC family transcriptional regulator of arabinose operon
MLLDLFADHFYCFYDMDNWFPSGLGRTESMAETQNDPLLPGYSFNAHLVAGLTPIEAEGYLDFYVDRPLGMKGYILNLTVRGEGVIKNNDQQFVCRPGDILLFPPGRSTTMAVIRMPKSGITSGSTSVRAPTGRSGFLASHFCAHRFLSPG